MDDCANLTDDCAHLMDDRSHLTDDCAVFPDDCAQLTDDCSVFPDDCSHLTDDCSSLPDDSSHLTDDSSTLTDGSSRFRDDGADCREAPTEGLDERRRISTENMELRGAHGRGRANDLAGFVAPGPGSGTSATSGTAASGTFPNNPLPFIGQAVRRRAPPPRWGAKPEGWLRARGATDTARVPSTRSGVTLPAFAKRKRVSATSLDVTPTSMPHSLERAICEAAASPAPTTIAPAGGRRWWGGRSRARDRRAGRERTGVGLERVDEKIATRRSVRGRGDPGDGQSVFEGPAAPGGGKKGCPWRFIAKVI